MENGEMDTTDTPGAGDPSDITLGSVTEAYAFTLTRAGMRPARWQEGGSM
jgi:hypothetical protein